MYQISQLQLFVPGYASLNLDAPWEVDYLITQQQWEGVLTLLDQLCGAAFQSVATEEPGPLQDLYSSVHWWTPRYLSLPYAIAWQMAWGEGGDLSLNVASLCDQLKTASMGSAQALVDQNWVLSGEDAGKVRSLLIELSSTLGPLSSLLDYGRDYAHATAALTSAMNFGDSGEEAKVGYQMATAGLADVFDMLIANRAYVGDFANFGTESESLMSSLSSNLTTLDEYIVSLALAPVAKLYISEAISDGLEMAFTQWTQAPAPLRSFITFWDQQATKANYPNLAACRGIT